MILEGFDSEGWACGEDDPTQTMSVDADMNNASVPFTPRPFVCRHSQGSCYYWDRLAYRYREKCVQCGKVF